MLLPKNLKTQLFNLVEKEETDQLIEFINNHKEFIRQLTAPNQWTLSMYAVRYGNLQLMRHLNNLGLFSDNQMAPYTLLYTACLNYDTNTLRILLDEFGKDVNELIAQHGADNTLLKFTTKSNMFELVELLCSRGAYYLIENVIKPDQPFANNMIIEKEDGVPKCKTVKDRKEISQQLISPIKREKDKLIHIVYLRYKNYLILKHLCDTNMLSNDAQNFGISTQLLKDVQDYVIPN